ncbi:MAG: cupin domain-containing protein [Propionibacteriaceae bacterium]|jgi:quercetin dioxygenase-like cupin family protein|nr:cupin domain-containing protein [Propionibacteriaceae bacterium]
MNPTHAAGPEAFPRGDDASSELFSGPVWLAQLLDPAQVATVDAAVYNVTFAPGCRNNWHSHSHGQILLATRGVGLHQLRGGPVDVLHPGDVIVCPPGVEHWHGAAPESEFTHIGISPNATANHPTWLNPVTDAEYAAAAAAEPLLREMS